MYSINLTWKATYKPYINLVAYCPLMPLDKDLDNNRNVKVDWSTIAAMCECNNHKHSFVFSL